MTRLISLKLFNKSHLPQGLETHSLRFLAISSNKEKSIVLKSRIYAFIKWMKSKEKWSFSALSNGYLISKNSIFFHSTMLASSKFVSIKVIPSSIGFLRAVLLKLDSIIYALEKLDPTILEYERSACSK
jgi:hypothetical protein